MMNSQTLVFPRRREGFTLVELLVVITIIGILMSLMLPAVQQVRKSARSLQCRSRLRNLALAVRQHEADHGGFPPGVPSCTQLANITKTGGTQGGAYCQGPNWAVNILAELDEVVMAEYVYNAMKNQWNPVDDLEHEPGNIGTWTPPIFICPSADKMSVEERIDRNDVGLDPYTSKGNYAACWGADTYMSFQNPKTAGAFGVVMIPGWKQRVGETGQHEGDRRMKGVWKMGYGIGTKSDNSGIPDGASNTLMLSEVLGFDSRRDARGGWILNSMGSAIFTARTRPNSRDNDHIPMCETNIPTNNILHCTENMSDGNVWAAARSRHPNGVNVAMCDGSVRFISDSVTAAVWRALSTRRGEEVVTVP